MASAFSELVEKNLATARENMRGRGADERVRKAADAGRSQFPRAQQIDHPQGLDATPPPLQAAAADMREGIDLFSRNHMNDLYFRYGPQKFHKAMSTVPAQHLHRHVVSAPLHPDVKSALLAAAAVQKAFTGGDPARPSGQDLGEYPDTRPRSLPTAPSRTGPHGGRNEGLNSNWHLASPVAQRPAGFNAPGTWVLHDAPSGAGPSPGATGRQWSFQPCSGDPVHFPVDSDDVGVGDTDDPKYVNRVGDVKTGDLVSFRGPGGSAFTAKITMVTTGAAIGEFDGQTVAFPLEAVRGHNVGGSDHATDDSTPGDLTDRRGPRPVGNGQQSPNNGLLVPHDGASNVSKEHMGWDAMVSHLKDQGHSQESAEAIAGSIARRKYGPSMNRGKANKDLLAKAAGGPYGKGPAHDPFYGGSIGEVGGDGVKPGLRNPDDGAPLTPYTNEPPYNPDGQNMDRGPGTNVQSGGLTPREYALIDRVVSHRGPRPVESAALKALRSGSANDKDKARLKQAMREHAFGAPGAASACKSVIGKI